MLLPLAIAVPLLAVFSEDEGDDLEEIFQRALLLNQPTLVFDWFDRHYGKETMQLRESKALSEFLEAVMIWFVDQIAKAADFEPMKSFWKSGLEGIFLGPEDHSVPGWSENPWKDRSLHAFSHARGKVFWSGAEDGRFQSLDALYARMRQTKHISPYAALALRKLFKKNDGYSTWPATPAYSEDDIQICNEGGDWQAGSLVRPNHGKAPSFGGPVPVQIRYVGEKRGLLIKKVKSLGGEPQDLSHVLTASELNDLQIWSWDEKRLLLVKNYNEPLLVMRSPID